MTVYEGLFGSREDLEREFQVKLPEDVEILYAIYEEPYDYSWDAYVVFKQGDKYGFVSGGHCSCNGLEGQWEPELYDNLDELKKNIESFTCYSDEHPMVTFKKFVAEL